MTSETSGAETDMNVFDADADVLKCLGTELVDREQFEENLVSRIQEHFEKQQNELLSEKDNQQEEVASTEGDVLSGEKDDSGEKTGVFSTPAKAVEAFSGSSILRTALERNASKENPSKRNSAPSTSKLFVNNLVVSAPEVEETEQERLIRCGESTPFGGSVEIATTKK